MNATFTKPKICSRCGATTGDPDPKNTFPTVEEVKQLFQNSPYKTKSNKGVNLALPGDSYFLETPYRTHAKASAVNGTIYIMPIPRSGNGNLGTVKDGTEVVIVAEQGTYVFFVTYDGRMGWNGYGYFGER